MKKEKTKKQIMTETDRLIKTEMQKKRRKELYENKEWYTIRSLLGNQWST